MSETTTLVLDAYMACLRKIRSLKNAVNLVEQQALAQRDAVLAAGVDDGDLRHIEKAIDRGEL